MLPPRKTLMKYSPVRHMMVGFVMLILSVVPSRAQNVTYNNLDVTGTANFATVDISGSSTTFGTWSEGGSTQGLTLNYADGTNPAINFIGSGTSNVWQWWMC